MKAADRNTIRIGIDRLGRALRSRSNVDRAIDLGVALESMLLHNLPRRDRGELKYRLALRGAALLSDSKPERVAAFNLLGEAYNLRSEAVHSGQIEPTKKGVQTSEVLKEAAIICGHIARRLIEQGGFPKNWETDRLL
jgi:hypothetical protein